MFDRAQALRYTGDVEFQDVLEEHRLDVAMVKDDGIAELNHVFDHKLVKFRESVEEIVHDASEELEEIVHNASEELEERVCLKHERGVLCKDIFILEKECLSKGGRRASSLPL